MKIESVGSLPVYYPSALGGLPAEKSAVPPRLHLDLDSMSESNYDDLSPPPTAYTASFRCADSIRGVAV